MAWPGGFGLDCRWRGSAGAAAEGEKWRERKTTFWHFFMLKLQLVLIYGHTNYAPHSCRHALASLATMKNWMETAAAAAAGDERNRSGTIHYCYFYVWWFSSFIIRPGRQQHLIGGRQRESEIEREQGENSSSREKESNNGNSMNCWAWNSIYAKKKKDKKSTWEKFSFMKN